MKRLLILLLTLFTSSPLLAQIQTKEEVRLLKRIYYERDEYVAPAEERAELIDLIAEMRADSTLKITIIGSCDKWGGKDINDKFSYTRAKWVVDYISNRGVGLDQMDYFGIGIDTLAPNDAMARRVDISRIVTIVIKPEPQPIQQTQQSEIQEPQTQPIETTRGSINLRTNLIYWLGGLINMGIEWRPRNTQLGVVVNGGYSFLGNTNWDRNLGGWFVAPELRYYVPRHEQWFAGAQLLAGGYNVKFSRVGHQGTMIGGGVMGGYKLALNDNFDMDFTLGVGYGHTVYDTYNHYPQKDINIRTQKGLTNSSVIPIQAGVNLIWKIN